MDDDMTAEGDIYKLVDCARSALGDFLRYDGFIASVIREQGADVVAKRFADIMCRKCGNEASGMFSMTKSQLLECYNEMRKFYFNETLERLVSKGLVKLSLDPEGNMCFDPVNISWSQIMGIDPKKGGSGESQKP